MVSLAMTVAGRWAQVLRNLVDDAHSCHGMPREPRKVERVFDVNLG